MNDIPWKRKVRLNTDSKPSSSACASIVQAYYLDALVVTSQKQRRLLLATVGIVIHSVCYYVGTFY